MSYKLLDLGCGSRKREGAIGVDLIGNDVVDVVHNLNLIPYPFEDNEFDNILMDNSLEHLDDILKTMEELHRISKPGAKIIIKVPYFRSHYAIDPTHKHYFAAHSFYYFDPEHEYNKYYRYSNTAFFKVNKVEFDCDFNTFGLLKKLRFFVPRYIANRKPMFYESWLGHLFPLNELYFELTALK